MASMWRKSQAIKLVSCAERNSRQVGPVRRGAGSIPAVWRICQTVEAAIGCPRPGQFALNPAMAPSAVLTGKAQHEVLDGVLPSGTAAASGVVPSAGDESAVPGQQRARCDREDLDPAAAGEQRGQGGEPETVRWLVPYPPLHLAS